MKQAAWATVFIFIVAGCGGPKGVVGRWKAKEAVPRASTEVGKKFEQVLLNSKAEFKGDGTMILSAGPMNAEGKYVAKGNMIEVTMPGFMGASSTTVTYELSADGSSLARHTRGSDDKLIFVRE